jgi:pantoate kinase
MYGKLLMLGIAGAVGYVIGARQGRPAYDKIARQAKEVWENPTVQKGVGQAQDFARNLPLVGEMASDAIDGIKPQQGSSTAAGSAAATGTSSGSTSSTGSSSAGSSSAGSSSSGG